MKLSALKTPVDMYCLVGFDLGWQLAAQMGLDLHDQIQRGLYLDAINHATQVLSSESSGIVLDAEYSYPAISNKADKAGLLLALEKQLPEISPQSLPSFHQHWGVENVRQNYGVAKLTLYYHPQEPEAQRKQQLVAEIYDHCRYEEIDLVVELLVYHQGGGQPVASQLLEDQLLAAQDFRRLCDMMALEFLGDALAAVTITAELDIPWLMTAAGQSYDQCKDELRACLESGAKGFLLRDVFLPQLSSQSGNSEFNADETRRFIETQARDRLIELRRITDEFGASQSEIAG
jgi:tagatose-1,6-bisphosphate aldolase